MHLDRRELFRLSGLAAGIAALSAAPGPLSARGIDATHLGLRPGSPDDQSAAMQRAIAQAAAARAPLALAPGTYRVGGLDLPSGAHIVGPRGACRLILANGPSLVAAANAELVTLSGLVLDGASRPLPQGRGLVHAENTRKLKIVDCAVAGSGGHGIFLAGVDGAVAESAITEAADAALLSLDARGLVIARNTIAGAGNNGIQVWRTERGDDGTVVVDNRIENVANRSGGNGQYGNAINAFRAGHVIVRGNRIRNCAFSAVRGNSAANIEIVGNSVSEVGETAFYSEFAFEGAVIADNIVDGAQCGVSVTNFNEGGRLAVVQGNILRRLTRRDANPDPAFLHGVGIHVEADTAVTGNVVESAAAAGILLGWGRYLRDVAATGNVVRQAQIGIGVSVVPGAGAALIANNLISGSVRGAILGLDHKEVVTGDLARDGAGPHAHLTITGNRIG
jgi:uncharacterized secreted repeat protein (TIGR03808 family)